MQEIIAKFLNEYIHARKEPFAQHPFATFVRNAVPEIIYSTGIVNRDKYLVVGSVGQGQWALVPWVCIFNKEITSSAQKGTYIVFLLSKNGDTLYLTLNQGCTDILSEHGKRETIKILHDRANDIRKTISSRGFSANNDISLGTNLKLTEYYQQGTVFYKAYHRESIPSDEEALDDLKRMIDIYDDYYDILFKHNDSSTALPSRDSSKQSAVDNMPRVVQTGHFDSWEIVDDNTAIKTCDKSFFEHNGSGVPKDICWFFQAENIPSGESVPVTIRYNGSDYIAKVRNDSTDRRRIQILWTADLGKQFGRYAGTKESRARFSKLGDMLYEVSFESGGEEELTVKETISRIKEYIEAKGFSYQDGLIENFYLSLKSKPFVILAGTSGTGKTRLVKLFAEAVGANTSNGRYKMVSVRPDWSDSSDLFGHVDLNGKFIPGAIIDFVKRAELDSAHPYFLCLDEMNLARVEYYLSDFLSVVETRDLQAGHIISDPLVSGTYYGSDAAAAGKYGTVPFPENLYVIGTVNMDETTFPFSRKVLDRANTIEFSFVDLTPPTEWAPGTPAPLNLGNGFLKTEYLLLAQCADQQEAVNSYCLELQRLNRILQQANAHVGYRVRDEVVFYLLNNKAAELLPENEAIDNEIMQKILPRIQGSSASIKNMLCELFRVCAGDYEGQNTESDLSSKMMTVAQKPDCKYPKSAQKIAFMVRRFEEDGFTSYWL